MRIRDHFLINILLVLLLLESLPALGTNSRHFNEQKEVKEVKEQNERNEQTRNTFPDIPWRQIKFISPQQSLSQSQWRSGIPSLSGKGMDHLYLLTQYVIDLLQTPGLPFGVIKEELFDNPIPVLKENRGRVCLTCFFIDCKYPNVLQLSIICIICLVVIPLLGTDTDGYDILMYCCNRAIDRIPLLLLLLQF